MVASNEASLHSEARRFRLAELDQEGSYAEDGCSNVLMS